LILPGDSLEIDTAGQVTSIEIPNMTLEIDWQAATLQGSAFPNGKLAFYTSRDYGFITYSSYFTATASSDGDYIVSLLNGIDLKPGDLVQVVLSVNSYLFTLQGGIPVLSAQLFNNCVSGWLPPNTPYSISLITGAGVKTTQSLHTSSSGGFSTCFPYMIEPDFRLIATTTEQVLSMRMPFLTARIEPTQAIVSGIAPPESNLWLRLSKPLDPYAGPNIIGSQYITASASGTYSVNFGALAPISKAIGQLIHFDDDWNRTKMSFGTPQITLSIGESLFRGIANTWGSPVTITLLSPTTTISQVVHLTTYYGSGAYIGVFDPPVQSNDQITIENVGYSNTLVVPLLTAHHDYGRNVLVGLAPPGSRIVAYLPSPFYPYQYSIERHTLADSTGHYGLDTSGMNFLLGATGYVQLTDSEGNIFQRKFQITGYTLYFPCVAR
jgi:hypothetical protein